MATIQETIAEIKATRDANMAEFNAMLDTNCPHVQCEECAKRNAENEIKRSLLSTKITEIDYLINQLENATNE